MEETNSDWRVIIGVLVGVAAILVVAAFLLWVVFYNDLTGISKGPSGAGNSSGSVSTGKALAHGAAKPAGYTAPSGAYFSLSPQAW